MSAGEALEYGLIDKVIERRVDKVDKAESEV
jgi:ATP-dependent protease ClpP protease subunit